MTNHVEISPQAASGNDFSEHEASYRLFLRVLKSAIAVIGGILILIAIFLT
jgi:hypothetical protein